MDGRLDGRAVGQAGGPDGRANGAGGRAGSRVGVGVAARHKQYTHIRVSHIPASPHWRGGGYIFVSLVGRRGRPAVPDQAVCLVDGEEYHMAWVK